MPDTVILFRNSLGFEDELQVAEKYFQVYQQRSCIPDSCLVVPRYSVLPFYKELDQDVRNIGSRLINTPREHDYVAQLCNWYLDLEGYTPKTWFQLHEIPDKGPFVLKGSTNSKKFNWNTHMFAEDKRAAVEVYGRLIDDGLIGSQDVVVRRYVPLRRLDTAPQGLPISEEYRFFVLDGEILSGGFYWSTHVDDLGQAYSADCVPKEWLTKVIAKVSSHIRFFVLDVARTADGGWIVIELNDAQMSGLSMVDPHELYSSLKTKLL